jgi:hypothetical protein
MSRRTDTITSLARELGLHADAFFGARVAILDRRAFTFAKAKLRDAAGWKIVDDVVLCVHAVTEGDDVLIGVIPWTPGEDVGAPHRKHARATSNDSSPRPPTSFIPTRTCFRSR